MPTQLTSPKQLVTNQPQTTQSFLRAHWRLLTFLVLLVALTAFLVNYDITTRKLFADVKNEVTKVENDSIKPAGGVGYVFNATSEIGNGVIDSLKSCMATDQHCPRVSGVWFAQMMPGDEKRFITSAFAKQGYTIDGQVVCIPARPDDCTATARKGDFYASMNVVAIAEGVTVPSADIAPNLVWRKVSFSVDIFKN